MLAVYRHGVACTVFFANAVLNVSPNLVRQSPILVFDRVCNVVESGVRDGAKATNVRETGTLEDSQSLLDSRYLVRAARALFIFRSNPSDASTYCR